MIVGNKLLWLIRRNLKRTFEVTQSIFSVKTKRILVSSNLYGYFTKENSKYNVTWLQLVTVYLRYGYFEIRSSNTI